MFLHLDRLASHIVNPNLEEIVLVEVREAVDGVQKNMKYGE